MALKETYRLAYEDIPYEVQCAACGLTSEKHGQERHHPAGRRKDAFLFTIQVHTACHQRIHNDPAWATSRGLLWKGRNSKVLSLAEAIALVGLMPFPPSYAIDILKKWKP